MSRIAIAVLLAAAPLLAAVDGTITNATTGKPQPNVAVSLVQPGQGGMQTLGSTRTGPDGKFRIDKNAEGPQLVEAIYGGVPYYKMLTPGSATSGVQVSVYDATKDAKIASISQHIVFLQPAAGGTSVNEVFFVKNDSQKTLEDTANGTLQFYVAGHENQDASVRVTVSAPGGMPVQRPAEATKRPGVYKVDYPIKPGETEFNISYAMPGKAYMGKSLQTKAQTRLVVPSGVTLEGAGVTSMGPDPSGKAMVYDVAGQEYSVKVSGQAAPAAAATGESAEEDTGQPQITQTNPRLYGQLPVVLGLAGVVLLLGFILLYRSGRNESRR